MRRECLDHVVVLDERHQPRILRRYVNDHDGSRTHISLDKDAPNGCEIELSSMGKIRAVAEVGGLHH